MARRQYINSTIATLVVVATTFVAVSAATVSSTDYANVFSARRGINIAAPFARMTREGPFRIQGQISRFHGLRRYLSQDAIQRLSVVGVELVRLPVNPAVLLENSEEARKILIAEVLSAADEFIQNKIAVYLDLHFWSPEDPVWIPKSIFDGPNGPNFEIFRKVIYELALAMGQRPHGAMALELLNEPLVSCDPEAPNNWVALQRILIGDVRRASADLPIVVAGCGSRPDTLVELRDVPFNDKNIIYTFHYYAPFIFTHQSTQYFPLIRHLEYPPSRGSFDDAVKNVQLAAEQMHSEGVTGFWERMKAANEVRQYFKENADIATIRSHFNEVISWARRVGVRQSQIFLGEFAPLDLPPNTTEADYESRLRWTEDVRRVADEDDFAYAYWIFEDSRGPLVDPRTLVLRPRLGSALGFSSVH